MLNQPIEAVIFDLDGVITDTAECHFIAWQRLAKSLGISFTREDNESLKGVSRVDSLHWILQHGNKTLDAATFEQCLLKKNQAYLALVDQLTPNDAFTGVSSLLHSLREYGYKLGVASASKNAALVIQRLALTDAFDVIGDASAVANSKPAPDIFLQVAQRLGVTPQHCVGVEDAVAGVQAIKSAGMFAIGIGDSDVLTEADIVYSTTPEIKSVLNIEYK